jgi:hypothetical protein
MAKRLKIAAITFHTNDEDKDHDTHVTVTVKDVNGLVCAQVDNDWGHFNDQSNAGPFGLFIRNQQTEDLLQSGSLTIRIDPNGHDTWRFNFNLVLTFNDGSTLSGGVGGLQLSQNNQQMDFPLQGLLTIASTSAPLNSTQGDCYIFSFLDPELVLDAPGASQAAGTKLNVYPTNNPPTTNQLWRFTSDGYIVSAMNANLVLDVAGGSTKPGTPVILFPKKVPAANNQKWIRSADGYITSAMNSNLVLDVAGASTNPGTPVNVYSKNLPFTNNQRWGFIKP